MKPPHHGLFIDGVYAAEDNGQPQFQALPGPEDKEVARLTASLAERIPKLLQRRGLEPGGRFSTWKTQVRTALRAAALPGEVSESLPGCRRPLKNESSSDLGPSFSKFRGSGPPPAASLPFPTDWGRTYSIVRSLRKRQTVWCSRRRPQHEQCSARQISGRVLGSSGSCRDEKSPLSL